MKGVFLFDTFWPFFKVAQLLAVFPYKKVTDASNGIIKLVPVGSFGDFGRFCLIQILLQTLLSGSIFYLMKSNDTPITMQNMLVGFAAPNLNKTPTDSLSFGIATVLFYLMNMILFWQGKKVSPDLCHFQDYITNHMKITKGDTSFMHKTKKYYYMTILVDLSGQVITACGMCSNGVALWGFELSQTFIGFPCKSPIFS